MKPENGKEPPKRPERKPVVRWEENQERLVSWDADGEEMFQVGSDKTL